MADINELEVAVAEVVDYLRLSGDFGSALREVVKRKITAQAAKENGLTVSDEELQKGADTFRIVNNLSKASDTENWLKIMGVSIDTFEEFLETNLLISKFKDTLETKGDKQKYIDSEAIKESVREMIYQDWLGEQLK
ncbi:MAG: hypothetical protein JXB48_13260 [Candidatus Latescibacteria bacterium]|nr:hypothetical protein [Candidatus Latescibacterota bacterium]